MLLHDDVMYQILLWLPVISLLRFKLVCRPWRAFIESSDFIKHHLHHHHYRPSLKDKNHSLIHLVKGNDSTFTFPLIPMDSFEESNTCLQLDCSDLRGYFHVKILEIVSYNGIICLDLIDFKREQSICLWNPATKQSRILPQSPSLDKVMTTIGFGFNVKNNDYEVVNLFKSGYSLEKRVEVYSLNTSSWRSITTVFPVIGFYENPKVPFNKGTCFFWLGFNSIPKNNEIFCFDFSHEMFRSISLPRADYNPLLHHISVVHDKIACVFRMDDDQLEIWVLNEYGRVNESWAKLHTVDPYSTMGRLMPIEWLSTSGEYIFFRRMLQMCRFNVVTQEMKNLSTLEKWKVRFMFSAYHEALVEFKESLVSVGKGNSAPADVKNDVGKGKKRKILTH